MQRKAPAMQVAVVPGVGHAPTLAEPEALAAIQGFLAEVP
jgi:pimeloyl-ACP methyl ester carboxylesterase